MKPKRIILIRHGESEANVDRYLFGRIPDYTIELTERGRLQAIDAGKRLKELVGHAFECLVSSLPRRQFAYNEEPRLREQEWGYLRSREEFDRICRERNEYGTFYYRIPGGEAGTDVYDRINDLLDSLSRDFADADFPENCVLVTHGLTIRLFLMRFFHLTVEDFESMAAPQNCALVILELGPDNRYRLITSIPRSTVAPRHSRPIRLPE